MQEVYKKGSRGQGRGEERTGKEMEAKSQAYSRKWQDPKKNYSTDFLLFGLLPQAITAEVHLEEEPVFQSDRV